MTTTLLASFPSPSQGVWHLGPVPIRAYALFIIIGIVAALLIGDRRWAARGGERGVIYDIALWAVPFGLVGGRLYHVMTDWKTYFGSGGAGPVAALRIWDGGLGIWGAVALGGVGAWIACRRRGIPLPAFGDAVAPGIVLAQAIGRLGNYFNQELYGRETTVPWGLEIFYRQDPSGIIDVHSLNGVSTGQVFAVVHPTFLYELLWNLLVFVVLILIDRRFKIGHGRLFALYVALYCVGRFGVELLRDDTATLIAGIRINSFTATFVFLGAVVYIILARKGREDPSTLGGHHDLEDEGHVPELAKELVEVAAGTGVVAAATVAGQEDVESESETDAEDVDDTDDTDDDADTEDDTEDEAEALGVFESADESESVDEFEALDDSDEVEADEPAEAAEPQEAEDESVVEAEVASPGVEVENDVEAEEQIIDEDHDPVDEDELEGLPEVEVTSAPASEQEEALEASEDSDYSEEPVGQVDSTMIVYYSTDASAADAATIVYASEQSVVEAVEAVESVDADDESLEGDGSEDHSEDIEDIEDIELADGDVAADSDPVQQGSRLGRVFRRRR